MNERIEKLAFEAGLKWKAQPPHYTNTNNPIDFPVSANRDLEKFAELIVRECARTASMFSVENKRIHPDIDPKDMPLANQMVYHSTCQCVAREIKELFGVEE